MANSNKLSNAHWDWNGGRRVDLSMNDRLPSPDGVRWRTASASPVLKPVIEETQR
jgi:hypothetical protein